MLPLFYSITPDITGTLYELFAHIALLAFLAILCYEGHRRQFPTAVWLLSLAIIITASLFGSRIAIFDIASWQMWWKEGIFPIATERTSIGVVLFLFPAIWFIKKGLRFKAPILDSLAFALPIVAILRRIGCLLAACCYGIPTESSWGLRYLGPSSIRDQHWAEAVIGADRYGSAAVHPVPVYFIVAAILCLFLLKKYRSYFQRAGNLTLFSLALLLGFRFFIEFFRAPSTNHQLGEMLLGLKQIQWVLLPMVVSLSITIWYRERKRNLVFDTSPPSLSRLLIVNVLLTAFVFWMQSSFTLAEKIGIHTFLFLSGVAFLVEVFKADHFLSRIKWQSSAIAVLALFMMSQSYPTNMEEIKDAKVHTIHGNFNHINLNDPSYSCLEVESGCGGASCVLADSLHPSGAQYNQLNFGYDFKRFKTKKKRRWRPGKDSVFTSFKTFGVSYQPEFFYDKKTGHRIFQNNVMPYFGVGNREYGLNVGIRLGSIWGRDLSGEPDFPQEKRVLFTSSFRLGSPDRLYLMTNIENSFAAGASVNSFDLNLTMNLRDFSNDKWEYLRFGISNLTHSSTLIYLEPAFNLGKHFLLTPRLGNSFRNQRNARNKETFAHPSIGLGLHYRIRN